MVYLTDEEIKMLKEMSTRKGVKGQRLIKDIIWLNTTQSRYKVGDVVKFRNDEGLVLDGNIYEVRYEFTSRTVVYLIDAKTAELRNDEYEVYERTYDVTEDNIFDYSSKNENVVFVNRK